MAPLCADNNNLMAYHLPMATSARSEASLMALAQQLVQQQQQQQQQQHHHNGHQQSHLQQQQYHHQALPALTAPCNPLPIDQSPAANSSSGFYTDSLYDFNPSSSTSLLDEAPSALDLPALSHPPPILPSMSVDTPLSKGGGALDESLAFFPSTSATATMAGDPYEVDAMSSEWMDCLMCDDGDDGMVCYFETNPCESSQSSEAATTTNSCYPCTPAEEALPDGFTVLEEAKRCLLQQQGMSLSDGMSPPWSVPEPGCSPTSSQGLMASEMRYRGQPWGPQSSTRSAMVAKVPEHGVQLMQYLLECAKSIDTDPESASAVIPKLRELSSRTGDPIQRLAAYFTDALSVRLTTSRCDVAPPPLPPPHRFDEPVSPRDLTLAHMALTDACPYFTFAQLTANQAILEAIEGGESVHIVDFGISQGVQWAALLQALAAGASRPRRVRITGIASPELGERPPVESLAATGRRLVEFGRSLDVEVEFRAGEAGLADPELSAEMIGVREGEIVAVNFMLELCNLLGGEKEGVQLARVLHVACQLAPRVVTVAEMDAQLDGGPFQKRFVAALHFFSAMFDSLEAGMGRECPHRLRMEWWLLGERILSMVGSADDDPRRRRLRSHDRWRAAMESAGFRAVPLSQYAVSQAGILLWHFRDTFTLSEAPSRLSLSLGWQNKPLITVSSWTTLPPSSPPAS